MTDTVFRTRITELFGIRYPILMGDMQHFGRSALVAAVVNAGAMGYIASPRSYDSLGAYRRNLRRCRELTAGRACGLNLAISPRHVPLPRDLAAGQPPLPRCPGRGR